jgi:hypothetical protein
LNKIGSNTGTRAGNRGKGRPKGATNHVTRTLKEAIQLAFDEIGGSEWLKNLAETDPRAFSSLLARLIPTETSVTSGPTPPSVWPDEIDLTPQSFQTKEAWTAFFSEIQKKPDTIIVLGGFAEKDEIFPIARRRAGRWICGGSPDPRGLVCDERGELLMIDPDPDV